MDGMSGAPGTDQATMMLFSPQGRENPYPYYAVLREAAAVVRSPFGPHLVTRYDTVDRVLRSSAFRTPRGFRDAGDPAGPPLFDPAGKLSLHRRNWLLFQSGDAHTRLRKLIMNVFTPRAIRAITPRIEALVEELLVPVFERGSFEVIRDLGENAPLAEDVRRLRDEVGELRSLAAGLRERIQVLEAQGRAPVRAPATSTSSSKAKPRAKAKTKAKRR